MTMKSLNEKLAALTPGWRSKITHRSKELAAEKSPKQELLEPEIPAAELPRDRLQARRRWKDEITRTFMEPNVI